MNICVICKNEFKKKRHTTGKYCGRKCAWEARGGTEFNRRIAQESAQKRGDKQRGKGEGKAYRKLNGRHEHRIIAEKIFGRPLKFIDVVHHKDGNKLNNDPDNLEVITRAQHMLEHGLGIPGKPLTHKPWEKRMKK